MNNASYMHLELPGNQKKLLLHTCCAPCSAYAMYALKYSGIETTILFYNPNIQPREEYEQRKEENKEFAAKLGMAFVDLDYNADEFLKRTKGYEWEPERGKRCDICFDMRFEKSAKYASQNGFNIYSSTLGLSRHKDFDQVNRWGKHAAKKYPSLTYWDFNFRKNGGENLRAKLAKEENMYHQDYCGCLYSMVIEYKNRQEKKSKEAP